MYVSERVLAVVREWIEKAESDLRTAFLALQAGEDCPADTVAFHAQQCAEKYFKALLVFEGIEFPRTHDIEELIALLPLHAAMDLPTEQQRRLTSYATVTRYPGDYEPVTLAEARRAVTAARRARRRIRSLLPAAALQRPRT